MPNDVSAPDPVGADAGAASPVEMVARSLRRERVRAGLSIGELSRRAGVAKSTLSQLESGTGNPSIETLWAVSTALGVPFSALLDMTPARVEVVRFGEGPMFGAATADYTATLLSAAAPGSRRDLYLVRADPGAPRSSEPHARGVTEHVVISCGRALVGLSDNPVELGPGDYIAYPADQPHVFDALERGTVALLVSETY